MRIILVSVCVIGIVAFTAQSAEAQLCAGAPSFVELPNQIGVGASFSDDAQGVGGHFAVGGEELFGGGGVGFLNYDEIDSTATTFSGFVGADLAADEKRRVFVCPAAGLGFGIGPDRGPLDVWTFNLQGGVHVGVIASQTEDLTVIPTFAFTAIYDRATLKPRPSGSSTSASDGSGIASVGVGFVLNGNVGIIPSLAVPFATVSNDPIFRLDFAFNFVR